MPGRTISTNTKEKEVQQRDCLFAAKKGSLTLDEYVCCENLAAINEPIAHIDKVFETCKGSWPNPLISHLIGSSYLFKVLSHEQIIMVKRRKKN